MDEPTVPVNPPLPPREEGEAYDCWEDKKYFDEYAKLDIHCDMLHDRLRMDSYYKAIAGNPEDFKGKVVLDVGCGTGILSCWCAKAGAARVYAVEACSIAEQAELIVLRNDLSNVVQVIRGKIEGITLPEQVDVIVSEWMGSFLLFESMLDSVLYARDKWLKQGGKIYPCQARLYVAPVSADRYFDKKIGGLTDVSGIDMSALAPFAVKEMSAWGIRGRRVKPESVLAEPHCMRTINLYTVVSTELQKTVAAFHFSMKKAGNFRGFASWFDVTFPTNSEGNEVILSTHPDNPVTHWRHDQFWMEATVPVSEGTELRGCVRMVQNSYWKRHFDWEFSYRLCDTDLHKVFST